MRILFVSNRHQGGGAEKVGLDLIALLRQNQHEVIHFYSDTAASLGTCQAHSHIHFPGFEVIKDSHLSKTHKALSMLSNRNPLRYRQLKRLLKEAILSTKADLVFFNEFIDGYLEPELLCLPKQLNTPSMMTFHGPRSVCPSASLLIGGVKEPLEICSGRCIAEKRLGESCNTFRCIENPLKRFLEIQCYRQRLQPEISGAIDLYTAPSQALTDLMLQSELFTTDNMKVLHNPSDATLYARAGSQPESSAGSYFLGVGRLESYKGFLELVKMFSSLPEIPLKIIGTGSQFHTIIEYIRQHNLQNIELVGWMSGDDLWEYYRNARGVILPSRWFENAPVVIQEAYAHRKAVIGFAMGGIPEFIEHGKTGYLVDLPNYDRLKEHVVSLWEDEALALRLGEEGYRFYQRTYHPDYTYAQLSQCMGQAIARHQQGDKQRL